MVKAEFDHCHVRPLLNFDRACSQAAHALPRVYSAYGDLHRPKEGCHVFSWCEPRAFPAQSFSRADARTLVHDDAGSRWFAAV